MNLVDTLKSDFNELFSSKPFQLIDFGCSGGIDPGWRLFAPHMKCLGVDFNITEIERLKKDEKDPKVSYLAGNLELPPDHPLRKQRGSGFVCESHKSFAETSAWDAHTRQSRPNNNTNEPAKPDYLNLTRICDVSGFDYVDFVKIDVDGSDFDILQALEPQIQKLKILGFKVEVNFSGSCDPHDHTFHNTDRLLRKNGFELFDLELRRYTKKTFPGKFIGNFFGQTTAGALAQGDALYFLNINKNGLDLNTKSKLVALMCLYSQIDSAMDVLIKGGFSDNKKHKILDAAAKQNGFPNYLEMMKMWEKEPSSFFSK